MIAMIQHSQNNEMNFHTMTIISMVLLMSCLCLFACKPLPTTREGTIQPASADNSHAALKTQSATAENAAHSLNSDRKGAAQLSLTRESYDNCISAAASMTPAIEKCIADEYAFQDVRLNDAYQKALARKSGTAQNLLRGEQREWIRRRDVKCATDGDAGQAGQIDAYECRMELTAARATELEAL